MAYSKLHSSIVNSSLWCEEDDVRILFITMLALADREGCVYGSRAGIFRAANLSLKPGHDPFAVLLAPDRDSSDLIRNPENEGRRIEEISGGFKLLNFEYYRGLRNDDDRRDQNRRAQAKFRSKNTSATVSHGQPNSASVSLSQRQKQSFSPKSSPQISKPATGEKQAEADGTARKSGGEEQEQKADPEAIKQFGHKLTEFSHQLKGRINSNNPANA